MGNSRPLRRFTPADAQAVHRLAHADPASSLSRNTRSALDLIRTAVAQFGRDALAISFNGGKDCTVLVHLLATALLLDPASDPPTRPIPAVYVRCPAPFPEVEHFVARCTDAYRLDLVAVDGAMRPALQTYLDLPAHRPSPPRAILVGTRRNDPHGTQLRPLQPTDPGWPDFCRVHPVLDWSYADIWAFLRSDQLSLGGQPGLEWCELYDNGYTSLGSTYNTLPNPLLRRPGSPPSWRPAWELEDDTAERAGRPVSAVPPPPSTTSLASTTPSPVPASAPAPDPDLNSAAGYGIAGAAAENVPVRPHDLDEAVPLGSNPPTRAGSPAPPGATQNGA